MTHERCRAAVAVVAGPAVLVLAAPPPSTALRSLADAGTSPDPTGPLVAAVALLAWALVVWLAATVAVVLLSRLPGLLGRAARRLSAWVAPVAVRRALEVALGLTVAVGALTPTAALAAPVPAPAGTVLGDDSAWDLDWPTRSAAPDVDPARTAPAAPPSASATTAPSQVAPPTVGATAATRPAALPAAPAPAAAVAAQPAAATSAVVVRPGDSLWTLAEASLRSSGTTSPTDRQVAQAWPRWWAANREVVGDDPDLLLPGTVLRPPPAGSDRP